MTACDKLLQRYDPNFCDMGHDTTLEIPDKLSKAVYHLHLHLELPVYVTSSFLPPHTNDSSVILTKFSTASICSSRLTNNPIITKGLPN